MYVPMNNVVLLEQLIGNTKASMYIPMYVSSCNVGATPMKL